MQAEQWVAGLVDQGMQQRLEAGPGNAGVRLADPLRIQGGGIQCCSNIQPAGFAVGKVLLQRGAADLTEVIH